MKQHGLACVLIALALPTRAAEFRGNNLFDTRAYVGLALDW